MRTLLVVLVLLSAAALADGQVTTPDEHLGRPVGGDFTLADWDEVSSYYHLLGEQSEHVLVESVGTTTEGRDFLLATISDADNLDRLDEIRAVAARLADPRGLRDDEIPGLLEDGRAILLISIGMHSTETAAPQFGMELAYRLATSDEEPYVSARRELVVVMAACTNPDGMDRVVRWYREHVGTPHEGTSLTELYQHYAGHDNNRDWFMQSLAETRIMTEQLYSVWRPQVYWDVHQQGSSRERFFVPPFRDPLNPNLDPGIISAIDALGSRALLDMTREGFSGVSTGVTYDMWWNGGNRNVPVRHNIVGLLTEAASVNVASPVFLEPGSLAAPRGLAGYAPSNRFPDPWPGGWWRLRHIIDYEHAFARSLLGSMAREPRVWMTNTLEAARRTVRRGQDEAPRAWVIPSDNPDTRAVRRLVTTLLRGGVELHVSEVEVEADGRRWPAGSLVISRAQPYGDHVKDLFEVQRYPDGEPPYDVAGWTLPLLMGVHRVEVVQALDVDELTEVESAEQAVAAFPSVTEGERDTRNGDAWAAFVADLTAGRPSTMTDGAGETVLTGDAMPRIGVYAPWRSSMDEGWLRWVLDAWDIPYVRVRNEQLRAGALTGMLDVLVVASIGERTLDQGRAPGSVPSDYAGGLQPEGAVAVAQFVQDGGTLVTLGASSAWAAELFQLGLVDVTTGEDAGDFSCPGSVLRIEPREHPLTAGLPTSMAAFYSRSEAWDVPEDPRLAVLMRYAPTRLLLSGWIREPQVIEGKAAWVRAEVGPGRVHLFGFRPQYRSWSQGTFPLLFRAMLAD